MATLVGVGPLLECIPLKHILSGLLVRLSALAYFLSVEVVSALVVKSPCDLFPHPFLH
jgi:hypothetical protein